MKISTIFGTYNCRPFTDVDPDVSGLEVSTDGGNVIGSMVDETLPNEDNEDEMSKFEDTLELWLIDNE